MKKSTWSWVNSKIKGRISEILFEDLFIELGFFVVKIGQEHTATPIVQIEKFIKTCGGEFRIDRRIEDDVELNYIRRLPDFLIIDKKGCVNLIEVKFRRKGKLTREALESLDIYKHSEVFCVSLQDKEIFNIYYKDDEGILKIIDLRKWLKERFDIEEEDIVSMFERIVKKWYESEKNDENSEEDDEEYEKTDRKNKRDNKKEESRIEEIKKESPNAYKEWTTEEEEKLKEQFNQGISLEELSKQLQRQVGGIKSRLKRLGLIDFDIEGDDTTNKTFYK